MEPIRLQNFSQLNVDTLNHALSLASDGANLVFKIMHPKSFFLGNVLRQTSIVWMYNNSDELHVFNSGCTFFLWTHSAEFVVITGLVIFKFELENIDVDLTFHIFDPVLFCTRSNIGSVQSEVQEFLERKFKGHENDDFGEAASLEWISSLFFEINQKLNKYGISINQLEPLRRTDE